MAARVFLALSALLWLPYGIWCFFGRRSGGRSAPARLAAFFLSRAPSPSERHA